MCDPFSLEEDEAWKCGDENEDSRDDDDCCGGRRHTTHNTGNGLAMQEAQCFMYGIGHLSFITIKSFSKNLSELVFISISKYEFGHTPLQTC